MVDQLTGILTVGSRSQRPRTTIGRLEDEHGFLTDQAIDPEEDPLEAVPAEEFRRVRSR